MCKSLHVNFTYVNSTPVKHDNMLAWKNHNKFIIQVNIEWFEFYMQIFIDIKI